MLDRPSGYRSQPSRDVADAANERDLLSLHEIAGFVRRYRWTILGAIFASILIALVYIIQAQPIFTARVQMIIDPKTAQLLREQTGEVDNPLDSAQVESQIAVLKSEKIAASIVETLNLTEDPEYQGGGGKRMFSWLFGSQELQLSDFERSRMAIGAFASALDVRRVGLSYVIEIQFSSRDPEKAARIANATAEAYINDQVEARSLAARRGGEWLEERIAQLRTQMNAAARAVQEFKTSNNIIDTGDRRLLGDQQIAELNSQLIIARGKTAEARARLERIEAIFAAGTPEASVVEALGNSTINGLRVRYLDAQAKETELSTRYGPDHVSAVSLRNEMQEYRRAMSEELSRIGETIKSDYHIARAREETIESDLQKLIRDSVETRRAQVTVAELEASAGTYRRIYESFLQAFTESVQRQSFPVSNARVITAATKPLNKSHPQSKLIVALAALVGGIGGLGIAVVRHGLDRSVRWSWQIRDEVGLDCLGSIPTIRTRGNGSLGKARSFPANLLPARLLSGRLFGGTGTPENEIHFREVADSPFSRFSDSLKAVKTSITISGTGRPSRCLGITSVLPREGKSTIACNLAALFAIAGSKTLVIDADIRNSTLTRTLAPQARRGLIELIAGTITLEEAILPAKGLDLHILPTFTLYPVPNSNDLLGSESMRHILDELRRSYDVIVVDLPPLKPVVDALAVSPFLDTVLLVTEWGGTPLDMIAEAAQALRSSQARVLGAVITKVDAQSMENYEKRGAAYYG